MEEELTYDQRLARQVEMTFREFMQFPDEYSYTAATLWVLHTHLRKPSGEFLPYITPRLYFGSVEAGAGKTLAMELTTRMSHNGEMSLENTSFGLTTMINIDRATVGIDEIDLLFGAGRGQTTVRAIINGGYKKGNKINRQRGDETDSQEIHGPMVLAGKNLKRFSTHANFETLRDRSIIIPLRRKEVGTELARWRPSKHEDRLRRFMLELAAWGKAVARYVVDIDVDEIIPQEIDNRDREIWEVLFQLAQKIGGEWPERVELAARAFVLGERRLAEAEKVDPFEQLRDAVAGLFGEDEEFLPTVDILDRLELLDDKPELWFEWTSIKAKEMGLKMGLEATGIKKVRVRTGPGEQPRGYTRASFGLPPIEAKPKPVRKPRPKPQPIAVMVEDNDEAA